MPLILPTLKELTDRSNTDVQTALPGLAPQNRETIIGVTTGAKAARHFESYQTLGILEEQIFPDTATEENLDRWAGLKGLSRLPASKASGLITITGTNGATIPAGTTYQSTAAISYVTTAEVAIGSVSLSVTSLTRVGEVATASFASAHNLTSAVSVTISGAVETEYNVANQSVTVTSETEFTYPVFGSPSEPATGTILAAFTIGSANVDSVTEGLLANQILNAALTIGTPIVGVDNQALVQFTQIGGGADEETDGDFRARTRDAYANPVSNFNVAAIDKHMRLLSFVDRGFIQEITPEVGDVTVYFTVDEVDIIPAASEVDTAQAFFLLIKPAHMSDASAIVAAPTALTVDFTFTALSPHTLAVRNAIETNLNEFFRTETTVGLTLTKDEYRAIIKQTTSLESGEQVQSFTLSEPVGDIAVASNEIPVLGSITFS